MNTWYKTNTSGNQGLVVDQNTGANIAAVYDAKNAALIAAAPELLKALEIIIARIDNTNIHTPLKDMSDTWNIARAAISGARTSMTTMYSRVVDK